MDTSLILPAGRRTRRRYSSEFKASVVSACQGPGVSIAAIALANGLNANMLRKWVSDAEQSSRTSDAQPEPARSTVTEEPDFVRLPAPSAIPGATIRVEIDRAGTKIRIDWPATAAAECGAWLHGLLK